MVGGIGGGVSGGGQIGPLDGAGSTEGASESKDLTGISSGMAAKALLETPSDGTGLSDGVQQQTREAAMNMASPTAGGVGSGVAEAAAAGAMSIGR
jgi:hypothetical protein